MPRRLKLATVEMDDLELFVIYSTGGQWEEAWLPLQGFPIDALLPRVTKETFDHALRGWTSPLIKNLGLPPTGGIRKVHQKCADRAKCPLYDPNRCSPKAVKMWNCFRPRDVEGEVAQSLAAEIIRFWREGVHVLIVEEM